MALGLTGTGRPEVGQQDGEEGKGQGLAAAVVARWGRSQERRRSLWEGSRAGSRVTAGSGELGQTHVAEQVFGQKDERIEFHVWQMWGAMARFCYFPVFLFNF